METTGWHLFGVWIAPCARSHLRHIPISRNSLLRIFPWCRRFTGAFPPVFAVLAGPSSAFPLRLALPE